jgi:subtilase family serine protease
VLTKSGSRYSETADGSSGGCATGIKKPKWQHDTHCAYRLANDAAAVAWNVAEYDTYGYGGWFTVGGTSVATPLLAGVFRPPYRTPRLPLRRDR